MINEISFSQLSFTGKTRRYNGFAVDLCESAANKIFKQVEPKFSKKPVSENYRAYSQVFLPTEVKFSKQMHGYGVEGKSVELPLYAGTKKVSDGFSTEVGGYGGGYILSDVKTPLSTTDVHTCACLNLVDGTSDEQLLYHVFHGTSSADIRKFVNNFFPNFTKINIVPGDMLQTSKTVKNILEAVSDINPKIEPNFYHFPCYNPEIVAYKGDLFFIKHSNEGNVTFKQVKNYNY